MKPLETIRLDEVEEKGIRRHRISYVPPESNGSSTYAHILPHGASRDEAAEALEHMQHLLVTGAPFPKSPETRSPSPGITMNTQRVAALVFAVLAAISALKGISTSEANTLSAKKPAIEAGVR